MIVEDRTEEAEKESIKKLTMAILELGKFGYLINLTVNKYVDDKYIEVVHINHDIKKLNDLLGKK